MNFSRLADINNKNSFLLVAMTGGIASGKTLVSDRLSSFGYLIIDADILAREAIGPSILKTISKEFGANYLTHQGELDRKKMADLIFTDPLARVKLEALIHPEVKRLFEVRLKEVTENIKIVIYVVPLLVEAKIDLARFDLVISILTDKEIALARILNRGDDTKELAKSKINSQSNNDAKIKVSDYVIYNNGSLKELDENILELDRFLKIKYDQKIGVRSRS